MSTLASIALPLVIALFVVAGIFRKVDVFDAFLVGAMNGLSSLLKIIPSLIALVFAVKLLRGSGLIDRLSDVAAPLLQRFGMPAELLPMALLKSVSGSGSTALLTDILETHGPDSVIGLMASVMCCSSETTFYTIAVYYGSVGIKHTRHTVAAALIADAAAVIFSVLFVNLLF